ncbi:MAG: hypothetical protein Q8K60_06175, partial [Parachlamydiaceae bacterium]|nr:hypothetical protein [Parachlamydiaceae bacterium]
FNQTDFFLRNLQSITKIFTKTATSVSQNIIHVGTYVGDGFVSEAISNGVRLTNIQDKRIKLKHGMTGGFIVIRPKNEIIAKLSSEIAFDRCATGKEKSIHKYSIKKGMIGSFSSSTLGVNAIKDFLKGAAFVFQKAPINNDLKNKEFFCSQFSTWCLQLAESKIVMELVNQDLPLNGKIIIPEFNELPSNKIGQAVDQWAFNIAKKHKKLFQKYISIKLDAKNTTPQRLYGFILEHEELFEHAMVVIPPQE